MYWRYRAFHYTVSLGLTTSSGERVYGIPQPKSRVGFTHHMLFHLGFSKHGKYIFKHFSQSFQEGFRLICRRMFSSFWGPCEVLGNCKWRVLLFISWLLYWGWSFRSMFSWILIKKSFQLSVDVLLDFDKENKWSRFKTETQWSD